MNEMKNKIMTVVWTVVTFESIFIGWWILWN